LDNVRDVSAEAGEERNVVVIDNSVVVVVVALGNPVVNRENGAVGLGEGDLTVDGFDPPSMSCMKKDIGRLPAVTTGGTLETGGSVVGTVVSSSRIRADAVHVIVRAKRSRRSKFLSGKMLLGSEAAIDDIGKVFLWCMY